MRSAIVLVQWMGELHILRERGGGMRYRTPPPITPILLLSHSSALRKKLCINPPPDALPFPTSCVSTTHPSPSSAGAVDCRVRERIFGGQASPRTQDISLRAPAAPARTQDSGKHARLWMPTISGQMR